MKAKKIEKLQLEKNSMLYFLIGLTLVLALIYLALEWKTYDKSFAYGETLNIEDDLGEIPPVTLRQLPPPPAPKVIAPPVIEVVTNDNPVIETSITTDEIDQNTPIMAINTLYFDEPEEEEVIFIKVEDKPVFPGCEDAKDQTACFQKMLQRHIQKNLSYPEAAVQMNLQGRVNVLFTIEKDGSIGNVQMRGPHKILEKEASRIIGTLPKMTPGKQRGKAVKVPFAVPITFQLQ
ncbi:protein TonB [Croceivirga lutea]|uniref:energy transducer TonB n=1 Tax=Croceivirga lutea TaxID=1775167 RepID=UPI0016395EBF|nr:energy transducer TonB [Croceivirga lutea]GGG53812.1 protein TonB [Croceivirga lutea]